MPLREGFDHPLPYTWASQSWNRSTAEFQAGELTYRVVFMHSDTLSNDRDLYACEFHAEVNGKKTVDVVGTGLAFSVLATVTAIMLDFLQTQKPDALAFTAEGESRIRLYRTLMRKLAGRLPAGYITRSKGTLRAGFYIYQDHSQDEPKV